MGQANIINVLQKSKRPLSSSEIATILKRDKKKICRIIQKMLKYKDIECIELDRNKAAEILKWKKPARRTRFYYLN